MLDLTQLRKLSYAGLNEISELLSVRREVLQQLRDDIEYANKHDGWDSGVRARGRALHDAADTFVPSQTHEVFRLLADMPAAWDFDPTKWATASAVHDQWANVTLADGLEDRARQALYLAYRRALVKLVEWVHEHQDDNTEGE